MTVTAVRRGGRPDLPLLVLGPSLGTSATALWSAAAQHLARDFQVVAWDLPGHGTNRFPLPDEEPLTRAGVPEVRTVSTRSCQVSGEPIRAPVHSSVALATRCGASSSSWRPTAPPTESPA